MRRKRTLLFTLALLGLAACTSASGQCYMPWEDDPDLSNPFLNMGPLTATVTIDGVPAPGIGLAFQAGPNAAVTDGAGHASLGIFPAFSSGTVSISQAPADVTWEASSLTYLIGGPAGATLQFRGTRRSSTPPPAGTPTPMADGGVEVTVLVLDGQHYPLAQFVRAQADQCDAEHYHSPQYAQVLSLEGGSAQDTNSGECGYGRVTEVPTLAIQASQAQLDDYNRRRAATR